MFTHVHAQHAHSYDPYWELPIPYSSSLLQVHTHKGTLSHTHMHEHTRIAPPIVQESYLLCGWLWSLAQGPSP